MAKTRKKPKPGRNVRLRLPPKRLLPDLDLDAELARHNVAIAELLILAGLIKGGAEQRRVILSSVAPAFFVSRSFPQYLYQKIVEHIYTEKPLEISAEWIVAQIESYFKDVWKTSPLKREIKGKLFTCAQILDFSPTFEQVLRAIELRREVAIKEGLI